MSHCEGTARRISDSSKLHNASKHIPKLYKKGFTAKNKSDVDRDNSKNISYLIEEIKKALFNFYAESR